MTLFRRRKLPPQLASRYEAFLSVVERVERAKAALTEAVPSTRFAGRPVPDVLVEFEEDLQRAAQGMPAWRTPEVQEPWAASWDALGASLALAERIRIESPDPGGFEGLIGLIGDLLRPLEAFEAAADAFRELRR